MPFVKAESFIRIRFEAKKIRFAGSLEPPIAGMAKNINSRMFRRDYVGVAYRGYIRCICDTYKAYIHYKKKKIYIYIQKGGYIGESDLRVPWKGPQLAPSAVHGKAVTKSHESAPTQFCPQAETTEYEGQDCEEPG